MLPHTHCAFLGDSSGAQWAADPEVPFLSERTRDSVNSSEKHRIGMTTSGSRAEYIVRILCLVLVTALSIRRYYDNAHFPGEGTEAWRF